MNSDIIALPIEASLFQITETFRSHRAVMLNAPPGAGKSTKVPLALLDAGFSKSGMIVLLEPRRAAARATAARMAFLRDEKTGDTVGYQTRFDKCYSPQTRILVMTEGILTRRLISDPFLEGISFIILDEFHERSVHSDLSLAFVKELMTVREDLRLLVMSATLETKRVSEFLGGCPIINCEGRQYPLTISYAKSITDAPIYTRAAAAVLDAVKTAPSAGDILVFMPGEREIMMLISRLVEHDKLKEFEVIPMYGALSALEQDRVLRGGNKRRIIVATNIAETSLTIPGITCVVDSGLRKISRFDPKIEMDRLDTVTISRSSADQRAGRAGRIAPGQAIRLWTAHEHKGLAESDIPEILRVDTAPILLQLLAYSQRDPAKTDLLDSPDPRRIQTGLLLLERLGALEADSFVLTEKGLKLARLPVHPRLGAVLLSAAEKGMLDLGASIAALAMEPDILDRRKIRERSPALEADFDYRLTLLKDIEDKKSVEASASFGLLRDATVRSVLKNKKNLMSAIKREEIIPSRRVSEISCGALLLAGFSDRVARFRFGGSKDAVMVGGRGISFSSPIETKSDLFVAIEVEAGHRTTMSSGIVGFASEVTTEELQSECPMFLKNRTQAVFQAKTESVAMWDETIFIDLKIREKPSQTEDPQLVAKVLAEAATDSFASVFSPDAGSLRLINRIRFAAHLFRQKNLPDVSEKGLVAMLPALCTNLKNLDQIRKIDWSSALKSRMDYLTSAWLNKEIPEYIELPSKKRVLIEYGSNNTEGTPYFACRIQDAFGMMETPLIAENRIPLIIHLLAPNMRPCQITADLKNFWNETYKEVRKELKGRYPKHRWPEDPRLL